MSLHVSVCGTKTAERHQRMVYGIPEHVGMWRPYTVLVTRDACSWRAFYSVKELKRWMRAHGFTLKLRRNTRGPARYSVARGYLVEAKP